MQEAQTRKRGKLLRVCLMGLLALTLLVGCKQVSPIPPGTLEPSFSITAVPRSVSFPQGHASPSITITIRSVNSFAGNVALEVSPPPHLTATLDDQSVTVPAGGQATTSLEIQAALETPPGRYSVAVNGTSGSLYKFVTLKVKVERMMHR